ncbi:MAG TPA: DUF1761 domain-containing protein [Spirochaetia bacterium]|nr:DUF1761 domain-containing protein [Spirochaetia bacterium]
MNIPINYLAVVVAALANYVIGAIWYSALFQKPWLKLSGVSEMRISVLSVVLALIGALLTSYVLDHAIIYAAGYMKTAGIGGGLATGFASWIGFIAPVTLGVVIYEKRSWGLWAINNGYWLLSLLVMGIILSAWT